MALLGRKKTTDKAAKPARAPRSRRSKPEPPEPPTFDAPPTLDEPTIEASAEGAPIDTIRDHDEEW